MNNKLFLFKSLIFIVICICILFINSVYFAISSTESYDTTQSLAVNVVGFDSKEEGDCIIITYENTEILIDSCQSEDCFNTIKTKMENCISSDGIWDYIIFTHPDYDHIGNAVKVLDLFDSNNGWSIDHIIDFDFVTSDDIFTNAFYTKTAKEYIKRRNELVEKYNIEYFSASSLSKSVLVKTYNIGKTASLTILYNYYDDLDVLKELSGASDSTKHNLISVCCLIQIDQQKLLFTGDLPEYDSGRQYSNEYGGESKLMDYHNEILDHVTFFKAGHHGSLTSNSQAFIDLLKPAYVAITTGPKSNDLYPRYPYNEVINRFMKYTDYIYITSVSKDNELYKLNGDIYLYFNGNSVFVEAEKNNAKTIREFEYEFSNDTQINWFEERLNEMESLTNALDDQLSDSIYVYTLDEGINSYSNCTLIKYGHYDILIDCGSTNTKSTIFVQKLKDYVVDGVIEYVIVSHFHIGNISELISNYKSPNESFDGVFGVFKVNNVIDSSVTFLSGKNKDGFYSKYLEIVSNSNLVNNIRLKPKQKHQIEITKDLSIFVLASDLPKYLEEDNCSMVTLINYRNHKLLFAGDRTDYEQLNNSSLDTSNVDVLRATNSAISFSNSKSKDSYIKALKKAKAKFTFVGTAIGYRMPGGELFGTEEYQAFLINYCNDVYFTGYINNKENQYYPVNGTLCLCIKYKPNFTRYSLFSEIRSYNNIVRLNDLW